MAHTTWMIRNETDPEFQEIKAKPIVFHDEYKRKYPTFTLLEQL